MKKLDARKKTRKKHVFFLKKTRNEKNVFFFFSTLLFHPMGCLLSLFVCFRCFVCRSVFDLLCLLLRCPVCAYPLRIFLFLSFIVSPPVIYLSFSLVVARFTCVFFFSLAVCIFLCLPSFPPPCVSPLSGLSFRSPGISCSFLSLPLAPVCYLHFAPFLCCGGSALRDFRISGFACLFCSASAFTRCSFFFGGGGGRLGVFSPVELLYLVFRFQYSLVGCSDVSWPAVDVLFGSWLCLFVFLFLLYFLCVIPLPFLSVFLSSLVCFLVRVSLPPYLFRWFFLPFRIFCSCWGLRYLPCFFPLAASLLSSMLRFP